MDNVQVFRKEVPPISVRELESELETLSALVDEWSDSAQVRPSDELFNAITTRLHPNLMKALVMIARKQTSSILAKRKQVALINLGRVRIHNGARKYFMQWVDVMVTEDGTPFLRRVALSSDGIEFHALTWAGYATISCLDTDRWDIKKKVWLWDAADCDVSAKLLRDGVLPYLPLHMTRHESLDVFEWDRHLEFVSMTALFHALDSVGEGGLHEIEREEVLKLLKEAQADTNPLWSHWARDGEYD